MGAFLATKEMSGETSRAVLAFATLASAYLMLALTGTRVTDLRRFCTQEGMAHEFLFYSAWVVIVTSSTYAITHWAARTVYRA